MLPHIAFNDPHLPWECSFVDQTGQSRVPWLAVLVFDEDELAVSAETLAQWRSLPAFSSIKTSFAQSKTMSLALTTDQLSALRASGAVQTTIPQSAGDTFVDTIFMSMDLFKSYFGVISESSHDWVSPADGVPSLDRYRYLSHVREVNTHGMREFGVEDETGLFSLCLAHRSGAWDLREPRKMVVHVVSLETNEISMTRGASTVALISLYSWSYTCVPPGGIDILATAQNLTNSIAPLRYHVDPETLGQDGEGRWLKDRLQEGYGLLRYIPQTGEQTASLLRGVLSPVRPAPLHWQQSNDGTDLQILDGSTGFLDLTYSAAWSLGRSLAISDTVFATAMVRLRQELFVGALSAAKKAADPKYMSRDELTAALLETARGLAGDIHQNTITVRSLYNRWWYATSHAPGTLTARESASWRNPVVRQRFDDKLPSVASSVASAGKGEQSNGKSPAQSSSWDTILAWILNKLTLADLPPPYILPDPNMLPAESIRTFYVDDTWLDCLVDGALSLGNHFDREDKSRREMKENVNTYLERPNEDGKEVHHLPRWGVFVRSKLVQARQDLKLEIPDLAGQDAKDKPKLVKRQLIADDTLMFLYNKWPEDSDFGAGFRIAQAAHQQQHSVGTWLDSSTFTFNFRSAFTSEPGAERVYQDFPATWKRGMIQTGLVAGNMDLVDPIYDWQSRTLLVPNLAKASVKVLGLKMAAGFDKSMEPSSALLALQLSDPLFQCLISTNDVRNNSQGMTQTPSRTLYLPSPLSRAMAAAAPPRTTATGKTDLPFVAKQDSSFSAVSPTAGTLGSALKGGGVATESGNLLSVQECSVWPLLTFRKAVPANHSTPLDLVWSIKASATVLSMQNLTIPPGSGSLDWFNSDWLTSNLWKPVSTTLSIPVGPAPTDLYDQSKQPGLPTIAMLDPAKGWKVTSSLSDDRRHLLIKLMPRRQGLTRKQVPGNASFVMEGVSHITGAARVTVQTSEVVQGLESEINDAVYLRRRPQFDQLATASSSFEILKEEVAAGVLWP